MINNPGVDFLSPDKKPLGFIYCFDEEKMEELKQLIEKNSEVLGEVKEEKGCKDYVDEMMRLWGEELL